MNETPPPVEPSPFIGPRPHRGPDSGDRLRGRERETRTLTLLALSQRVVVLHGPPGVGKTSLITAGVLPTLVGRAETFPILNIDALAASSRAGEVYSNPYLALFTDALSSTLADVNAGRPRLAEMLARVRRASPAFLSGGPPARLLVVDQIEELFVEHGRDAETHRADFFDQLGEAVREDSHLHLVLVVAHESLPALLRAARPLPDRLSVQLHLEPLDQETAVQIVREALEASDRSFSRSAPERLAELAAVASRHVAAEDSDTTREAVDPILLQAIGVMFWEDLTRSPRGADIEYREPMQSNDEALDTLYERLARRASSETTLSESHVRRWIAERFISALGTRSEVAPAVRDESESTTAVAAILERAGFIEHRSGASSNGAVRLSHDRLIPRILASNRSYFLRQRLVTWLRRSAAALAVVLLLAALGGIWAAKEISDLNDQIDELSGIPALSAIVCSPQRPVVGDSVTCAPEFTGAVTSMNWSVDAKPVEDGGATAASPFQRAFDASGNYMIALDLCNADECVGMAVPLVVDPPPLPPTPAPPRLVVDPSTVELSRGGTVIVRLNVSEDLTVAWEAIGQSDWLAIAPSSGMANGSPVVIEITVDKGLGPDEAVSAIVFEDRDAQLLSVVVAVRVPAETVAVTPTATPPPTSTASPTTTPASPPPTPSPTPVAGPSSCSVGWLTIDGVRHYLWTSCSLVIEGIELLGCLPDHAPMWWPGPITEAEVEEALKAPACS